jgi:PilZ domain
VVRPRDGRVIPVQILNVSDGGVAFRLLNRAHLRGSAVIRFTLPNEERTLITAVADLRWSRGPIFGMKFSEMRDEIRKQYSEWLSSMALI